MTNTSEKKRKFKVPSSYVLLFSFVIAAAVLTYIIPAGVYDRVKNAAGTTVVDPTTFHFIQQVPVNLWNALLAIVTGFSNSQGIIFGILLTAGAFSVVIKTGAFEAGIDSLIGRLKDNVVILIPIIVIIMAILGYLEIIVNATLVFIPIGLVVAYKLKLDPVVGLAMMYLGTFGGFTFSGLSVSSVQLANGIAGLPLLDAIGFRTVVFIVMMVATILYLMRYVKKTSFEKVNSTPTST